MDFNATVDLIIKDLEEVRAIIDDLKNYPGIPALQIELAKSKCKSAGEVIALLKNMQRNQIQVDNTVPADKEVATTSAPGISIQDTPKTGSASVISDNKPSEINKTQSRKNESPILADTFSKKNDSLNEKLGIKREEDEYSDIIRSKPLINLSDAIGVNDKFLFIREIFDGNPESYEQAISKLDNAKNMTAAREIIKGYTEDNLESGVPRQLLDLLKRKFSSDE